MEQTPESAIVLVVAGNEQEAQHYISECKKDGDPRKFISVSSFHALQGISRFEEVRYYGTFSQRRDILDINNDMNIIMQGRPYRKTWA